MIELRNLTFGYGASDSAVLKKVNLTVQSGQFVLVCGPTGSGKSTLLQIINGLAPQFSGGQLAGSVIIDGQDVTGSQPHDLADQIGYVNQQPEGAFVTDTVEEELAYGMEQLGIPTEVMRERVTWIAERLGLTALKARSLATLSGGQQQRVAIGSAIAAGQKILLLDEPTSALDHAGAIETLDLLKNLVRQDGFTVLIAEHRLDRVLPLVDLVVVTHGDGSISVGGSEAVSQEPRIKPTSRSMVSKRVAKSEPLFEAKDLSVKYGQVIALPTTSFSLDRGEVLAVTGDNGSGKTSLLWAALDQANSTGIKCAMVPQVAADLLFLSTIGEELAESDKFVGAPTASTGKILETLIGRIDPNLHPRDLSAGQQLALALAVQLVKGVDLVLLDEPTRGLDAAAKQALTRILNQLATEGKAIILASHDREFIDQISDRALPLGVAQ